MGLRDLLVELLSRNLEYSTSIDFYITRSYLVPENEEKDVERAYRVEERNSELRLETARYIRELFEIVGLIINLFHIAPDHQMIKDLYEMLCQISELEEDPEYKISDENIQTIDDLKKWDEDVKEKIRKDVANKIASPIDKLLNYIGNELNKETQPCELRCCLCKMP